MKIILSSIFSTLLLISCDSGDKYLGRLSVKNNNDVYFDLYQEQKFDHNVAITYSIIDKNKGILLGPLFLIGTNDFDREDTKDFTAGCYDSIIYLTFIDSTQVYALFDLKTRKRIDLGTLPRQDTSIENRFRKNTLGLKLSWYE